MRVLAGTSGYSYDAWAGSFYPEGLPKDEWLRFYGGRFPAVEVNNTFYRMPSRGVLAEWAGQVPEDFRFVLKASRRITHERRLNEIADPMAYLLSNADTLGARLGPFLFQLPPFLHKEVERLKRALRLLEGRRAAFEFRHASWFDDEVYDALRSAGAALCVADMDDDGKPGAPLVATADWGYLRLRRDYAEAELGAWAERVKAQPWREAFVFFKHEEGGKGPELAARFAGLSS